MYKKSLRLALAGSTGLLLSSTWAQTDSGTSLTVGTIKDQLEASVVRVLIKQSDSWSAEEKLHQGKPLSEGRETFYTSSHKVEIDATDKGSLGGVVIRYGARVYSVENKLDPELTAANDGKPFFSIVDTSWIHVTRF